MIEDGGKDRGCSPFAILNPLFSLVAQPPCASKKSQKKLDTILYDR